MSRHKPPSESVLARAVEARVAGGSWEAVGESAGRSAHTVRKWPQMYPERWLAAQRAAERTVIDDAAAEGVCILRQLLRADDSKIRVEAAWRLIYQRLALTLLEQKAVKQLPPEPPSDAHRIAEFVEAHSDDELTKLVANLLRARVPKSLATSSESAPRTD